MFIRKHPVISVILIIIIGFFVVSLIVGLAESGTKKKQKDNEPIVSEDMNYKVQQEKLKAMKKEKSDIKGLTKYEKYKKGLNPEDGSDTDGDGLTDKEEIEKYHSDPLKMSTAGDLYTDGEKVEKGLDLNKKFSYKGKVKYDGNSSKGVIKLSAKTAYGRFANVSDLTGFDSLGDKKIYKEYLLTHFDGTFSIDISKIKGCTDAGKVAVYISDGSSENASAVKAEVNGDIIKIDKSFDKGNATVFITEKSMINLSAKITNDAAMPSFSSDSIDGIAYSAPILDLISGEASIRYMDSSDPDKVRMEKEGLLAIANSEDGLSTETPSDSKKIKAASKSSIERQYSFFKKFFPFGDINKHKDSPFQLIFSYAKLSDGEDILTAKEQSFIRRDTVASGFKISKDALPFGNFGTDISTGGVCAGIATYTAQMFNSGRPIYTKGTISHKGKDYAWDITGNAFKDLRTKGKLHSFKNSSYVTKHKDDNGVFSRNLSEDDKNFSRAMSFYWALGGNACSNTTKQSKYAGKLGTRQIYMVSTDRGYSYKTVEWMKKRIDSGKIVSIGVTLGADFSDKDYKEGKHGHMINLTDYEDCDDGRTIFKVYDNNLPDRDDLVFVTKKVTVRNYKQKPVTSFVYKYQPKINGKFDKNYLMTNLKTSPYWFNVIDESNFTDVAIAN